MSHLIKQVISNTNVVFLIDCKSVLQSVQNESQDNAIRNVKHQFIIISRTNNAVFQWISAHCGITGNQSADKLAKQTSECQQHRHRLFHTEMKTPVKGKFNTAGKTKTESTYPSDPHHASKPTRTNNDIQTEDDTADLVHIGATVTLNTKSQSM